MDFGAETRARHFRWSFPGKAEVIHQKHGSVVVPAASKLAAVLCAAECWKCPWDSILDAQVLRLEKEEYPYERNAQ